MADRSMDQGSMRLAPWRTQIGDELVFSPGGKYPLAIRRKDNGACELIGGCFLYDCNIFGLSEDLDIEVQEFVVL